MCASVRKIQPSPIWLSLRWNQLSPRDGRWGSNDLGVGFVVGGGGHDGGEPGRGAFLRFLGKGLRSEQMFGNVIAWNTPTALNK